MDDWDDHGHKTTFQLWVGRPDGDPVYIGFLRIAHMDMETDEDFSWMSDRLPERFKSLPEGCFSLGQEDDYYAELRALPNGLGVEILRALSDVAYDYDHLYPTVSERHVFKTSLMRDTSADDLLRMHRIARGGERVTPYEWEFTAAPSGLSPPHTFTFRADPGSLPPTNLHALIGRNGVGKSHLLHALAREVSEGAVEVRSLVAGDSPAGLQGCVVVSFSPFDKPYTSGDVLPIKYVGLRRQTNEGLKSDEVLLDEFVESFRIARIGARGTRWLKAVSTLNYAASGFLDGHMEELHSCMRVSSLPRLRARLARVFGSLSSGHKVVLLTVTRLIELVTERTLVLVDEPETHLHPPLLVALMRCVSDLMSHRNGMAIMATHSPVVLQEVPRSCVWKLERHGDTLTAYRLELETYGENLGELTHAAFGLEVPATGYHARIAEMAAAGMSYEEVVSRFTGLGSEARSLARALTYARSPRHR
ncbi:AAA family ATPase [Streptomyces sp. NPDC088762]|uniref:AAA family ATPase n=1 Tax=Streptomyces sp. NPDC088762 TaxID=3365891 RepID=UPI0037FA62AE